jgi:hypothetical protein
MSAPDHWPGLTLLAATVFLEAEGELELGQLAVAFNPCNRARYHGWELHRAILGGDMKAYDDGKPYEIYSCWNDDYQRAARLRLSKMADLTWIHFYRLAAAAWWEFVADPSRGGYFYLNPELTRKIRGGNLPDWWESDTDSESEVVIGNHAFRKRRDALVV